MMHRPTQARMLTAPSSSSRAHPRLILTISTSYSTKSFVENPLARHHRLSSFFHTQLTSCLPPFFLTVHRIENYTTSDGDVPVDPIVDVGELSPDDPYKDYPEDDFCNTQDLKVALEAATTLRTLGNARWKEGAVADALAKWQKALCYLDLHHDAPEDFADEFIVHRSPHPIAAQLSSCSIKGTWWVTRRPIWAMAEGE